MTQTFGHKHCKNIVLILKHPQNFIIYVYSPRPLYALRDIGLKRNVGVGLTQMKRIIELNKFRVGIP